jgi:hypothetical protein
MSKNGNGVNQELILAEIDAQRRVYLCEFGIVHLKWRENDLVYCPGDFIGLPFLLSALANRCSRECLHGEPCPHEEEDGLVYLPYHSVRLPFLRTECSQIHDLAMVASQRLHEIYDAGFFAAQRRKNFLSAGVGASFQSPRQ